MLEKETDLLPLTDLPDPLPVLPLSVVTGEGDEDCQPNGLESVGPGLQLSL